VHSAECTTKRKSSHIDDGLYTYTTNAQPGGFLRWPYVGNWIGQHLTDLFKTDKINPADVGTIIAAGCIAHDVGNPPFGHSGEEAFAQWANKRLSEAWKITTDASRHIEK
jgi:hypothetical protein